MIRRAWTIRQWRSGATLFLMACLVAPPAWADTFDPRVLRFDETQQLPGPLHYKRDKVLRPRPGPFEIAGYSLMSNDLGERWALITFRNTSDGARVLANEHVVASFANGEQVYAANLNERLAGGELYTQAVSFGARLFPIVHLEVRTIPGS